MSAQGSSDPTLDRVAYNVYVDTHVDSLCPRMAGD